MERRDLLAAIGTGSVALAGCLSDEDDTTEAGETNEDSGGGEAHREGYELVVLESRDSVISNLYGCEYDELPSDVQQEVEEAIETGSYPSEERPEYVQMECYGHDLFIEYEGQYYRLVEEVGS